METPISLDDIKSLGPIPEHLHTTFLRVANGLVQRANYSKEKAMGLMAQMLQNPKKFAYSRNKVTNLARSIYELNKQGIAVPLSENGAAYLPPEPAPYVLDTQKIPSTYVADHCRMPYSGAIRLRKGHCDKWKQPLACRFRWRVRSCLMRIRATDCPSVAYWQRRQIRSFRLRLASILPVGCVCRFLICHLHF